MLDVRGQPPAPRTTILAVRGGQSVCFGRRAQAAWVVGGGRGVCFDEQGCPLPRARAALRGLPLVPKAGLKSVDRDVPGAQGRGRALAVATRVLAGFPRPRSLSAERSPSCSRGGILCLRQLLKWALPLEQVQEHCNLLLSIINHISGSRATSCLAASVPIVRPVIALQ